MILTGRTGLIALLCVLPIALSPRPAASFTVLLALLAAAVIADTGLAASPSRLLYTRLPNGSVRLGESMTLGLLIHNGGRRRFRGRVRDAWPPSAQAEPPTHAVDIVAGQVQRVDTCLRPIRRGDQQSAAVTARSIGPLGLAGRQKSRPVPGQLRVLPPFLSRKHLLVARDLKLPLLVTTSLRAVTLGARLICFGTSKIPLRHREYSSSAILTSSLPAPGSSPGCRDS